MRGTAVKAEVRQREGEPWRAQTPRELRAAGRLKPPGYVWRTLVWSKPLKSRALPWGWTRFADHHRAYVWRWKASAAAPRAVLRHCAAGGGRPSSQHVSACGGGGAVVVRRASARRPRWLLRGFGRRFGAGW